jgi:threonine dehydratase
MGVAGVKQYVARHKCKGQTFVAVTCGANMNFDRLRFVAERAEFGEQREALFAVTIPEERGSFKRFCELIGPRSVTEFNYRISDEKVAHVFVGLTISKRDEADRIARNFVRHGFATVNLTDDELAKEHVRHMVGGHTELAQDERLFRFVFPERPGALMRFLAALHPGWNISLFHYRNQGADYGRILVGIQVPASDEGVPRLPAHHGLPARGRDGQPGLPPVPALSPAPGVPCTAQPTLAGLADLAPAARTRAGRDAAPCAWWAATWASWNRWRCGWG